MRGLPDDRYQRAEAILRRYSNIHIAIDVCSGLAAAAAGAPGAGTVALMASIAIQAPVIYHPMVRELGALYGTGSSGLRSAVAGAAVAGGIADITAEFGLEFLKESALDILHDYAVGVAIGVIPVAGGIAAAIVDAYVAKHLTRLVALMAMIYYENGGRWPASRNDTRAFLRVLLRRNKSLEESVTAVVGPSDRDRIVDAATLADGLIAGAALGDSADQINGSVLEAMERWKHVDPHSIEGFEHAFTSKAGVYADPQLLTSLKGFVGEQITAQETGGTLPDATNVKAWDILWNGQEWQIKVGTTAAAQAREALAANPSHPIMTDSVTANELHSAGYPAHGLPDLDNSHLTHLVDGTTGGIEELANIGFEIPLLSATVIAYAELCRFRKNEQTLSQTIAAITVKVGSRSVAIFAASTVAILAVSATGILAGGAPIIAGSALVAAIAAGPASEYILSLQVTQSAVSKIETSYAELKATSRKVDIQSTYRKIAAQVGRNTKSASVRIADVFVLKTYSVQQQRFFERYHGEDVAKLAAIHRELDEHRGKGFGQEQSSASVHKELRDSAQVISLTAQSVRVTSRLQREFKRAYRAMASSLHKGLEQGKYFDQLAILREQVAELELEQKRIAEAERVASPLPNRGLVKKMRGYFDRTLRTRTLTTDVRRNSAEIRRELRDLRRQITRDVAEAMKDADVVRVIDLETQPFGDEVAAAGLGLTPS